ncbi:MAG: hypothetical protein JO112_08265 [Planctomycetes bacterium]|nr:hypothetical protein [Planctomycetota bacterium]
MDIHLEQAIYGSQGQGGYQFLARSPDFLEEWLEPAQQLCAGFGDRPPNITCPACVFARPFARNLVAIVQVADLGTDDTGRPGALGFYLLVLSAKAYQGLGGDPFWIAEHFPPRWSARGELAALLWPGEPPPYRPVAAVQHALKRPEGPSLLGGAQVLVDGGRLVFERQAPDTALVRDLWTLLPTSTRTHLWPASFAFGNDLGFHVLVVPRVSGEAFARYVTEEQAADYPEGRYELNLQIAAEAGQQGEVDALFARRSRAQTWRLGLILLGAAVLLALFSRLLAPPPKEPAPGRNATQKAPEHPSTGKEPS